MARQRRTASTQLLELGIAAPQVVAHRLARMAAAGPRLSARDRREFTGMVVEKQAAFAQAWMAMWVEGWRVQQQWWVSWLGGMPAAAWQADRLHAAWEQVAARGIAPVRRRAVANARRLSPRR
ncbi:polyhydroxyalkanoate granule-associated phasin [Pseudoxanthomonas sp. 10H]|uniref:polyhydroxyalkanoate granule-associated phasin n=1 Tax=Pseudoxanthomonas sp. 10H TaxID=3242729 RepID=UPI003558BDC9